ncbi:MAG: hypothetical protein IJ236_06755 [Oscillospiraceae bacterium]|nr:hypothetical protein [Oscillospiraceae bacterium]MBQ9643867.1 hypothetical protein [Lachnospiraceae bacterium]
MTIDSVMHDATVLLEQAKDPIDMQHITEAIVKLTLVIPKPVEHVRRVTGHLYGYCPRCGQYAITRADSVLDHCLRCGQRITWEEAEK